MGERRIWGGRRRGGEEERRRGGEEERRRGRG
jgi:hypothetical protein